MSTDLYLVGQQWIDLQLVDQLVAHLLASAYDNVALDYNNRTAVADIVVAHGRVAHTDTVDSYTDTMDTAALAGQFD